MRSRALQALCCSKVLLEEQLAQEPNSTCSYGSHPCVVSVLVGSCQTLWPHKLQPAWLLCTWNVPGKNTGVCCHFLLQEIFPTQDRILVSCIGRQIVYHWATLASNLIPVLERSPGEGMATHSSVLALRIPWTVQSLGLQIVGHGRVTFTFFHFFPKIYTKIF